MLYNIYNYVNRNQYEFKLRIINVYIIWKRWTGHVAIMRVDAILKVVLVGRSKGRRPQGRPRKQCKLVFVLQVYSVCKKNNYKVNM